MKKLYLIFILTVFFSLFNQSYAVISTTAPIAGMNAATTPAAKPAIDIKKCLLPKWKQLWVTN